MGKIQSSFGVGVHTPNSIRMLLKIQAFSEIIEKNMQSINKSIFKSYDIRGIYPAELNEEVAYQIGRAFAIRSHAKEITVGSDMRISSPELKKAIINGIIDEGVDVKDIGLVPIEVAYFSVGHLQSEASVMITASHNPKEYNGFKMVLKDMVWVRGIDLLNDVNHLPDNTNKPKGNVREEDIIPFYINYITSLINLDTIKPFTIVIDAGNGMSGKAVPILTETLPIKTIPLNFTLDGNFPAHPSNFLLPESQIQISKTIKKEHADFGFMFDGDADRMLLLDEHGVSVSPDITLLLLAKYFLKKNPGMAIAYNNICSKGVAQFVNQWKGLPIKTAVGFVNVREGLIKHNGIMGGELSGHYCFKDYFYMDSGMIAFLTLLTIISQEGKKVSDLVKELSLYVKTDMNFEVKDKDAVLQKVKEKYSNGKQDFLDGITIEYKDWWFNVRPSNTEPLLRLTIEANTPEMLKSKKEELTNFINNIS